MPNASDQQEGRRVLLRGKHPWAGYSGEVIYRDMAGVAIVRLDNGQEVQAWPRQYRLLVR